MLLPVTFGHWLSRLGVRRPDHPAARDRRRGIVGADRLARPRAGAVGRAHRRQQRTVAGPAGRQGDPGRARRPRPPCPRAPPAAPPPWSSPRSRTPPAATTTAT